MTHVRITQEIPKNILPPPCRVVNAEISTFDILVDVGPDGDYCFTAYSEAMHYLDTETPVLNIYTFINTLYSYGSKLWEPIVSKVFDSF